MPPTAPAAGAGSRTTCRRGNPRDAASGTVRRSCPYCAVRPGPVWPPRAGKSTPGGMTSEPGSFVLPFPDRRSAGRLLAERLADVVDLDQWSERTVVLALPRGGVAV